MKTCGGIYLQIQNSVSDSVSVESTTICPNRPQSLQISFCQNVMILAMIGADSALYFSKNHLILWGSHFANQGPATYMDDRGET